MFFLDKFKVILIVVVIILVAAPERGFSVSPVMECEDILRLSFTDNKFNKPITITSAKKISASGVPEYCEVKGNIWPEIQFIVALPIGGNPNAKLYQVGGGAWGGNLPTFSTLARGLSLGYTVAGNNGGHDVAKEPGAKFAWNNPDGSNPNYLQKIEDFGYRANVETNLLARKLIKAFYGVEAKYAYWIGCSQGGREGMTLSQKFPDLWNGFVIGAPAPGVTWLNLRGLWNSQWGQMFYDVPPSSPVQDPPNPTVVKKDKLVTLSKAVYEKCDSVDGVADGLIGEPWRCNFDPLVDLLPYACPNDIDVPNSGCLTLAQRTALRKMYDGIADSSGKNLFPGVGLSAEYLTVPGDGGSSGFTIALYDRNAPSFVSYVGDPAPGPNYDWLKFNWDKDWQPIVRLGYSQYWDHAEYQNGQFVPTQGGLEPLRKRGGKIIHYHGLGDVMWPTSKIFYDTLLKTMGYKETQSFYKLYLVPGMGHCAGGIGCYDGNTNLWFLPLVDWVEKGVEPDTLIGTRVATPYLSARTRPICAYPKVARYKGEGDIDKAENFVCVYPTYVESKTTGVTITDYSVKDTIDKTPPSTDFQFDRMIKYTATLPSGVKEASISVELSVVPTNLHVYKLIGSTWKLIYPTCELKGIKNVFLSGTVLTYTIEDNSEADTDTTLGKIVDPLVLGSYPETHKGGPCFIATVAFGSYLHPYVSILREFRDRILLKNWAGQKFVALYYRFSPSLADRIRENEGAKYFVRVLLIPVVGMSLLSLKMGFGIAMLVVSAAIFLRSSTIKRDKK